MLKTSFEAEYTNKVKRQCLDIAGCGLYTQFCPGSLKHRTVLVAPAKTSVFTSEITHLAIWKM